MFRKCMAVYLMAAMFMIAVAPRANAAFSPSEAIALAGGERASNLNMIQSFLERKLVMQRLADLGFSVAEVQDRLSGLSDGQVHGIAQDLDGLRTGGILTEILTIALIVLVVILILEMTGREIVIK